MAKRRQQVSHGGWKPGDNPLDNLPGQAAWLVPFLRAKGWSDAEITQLIQAEAARQLFVEEDRDWCRGLGNVRKPRQK